MSKFSKIFCTMAVSLSVLVAPFAPVVATVFDDSSIQSAVAATKGTGYDSADDVKDVYSGNYLANWGARDETCVFLSRHAEDFYAESYSFDQMSLNAGSDSISAVPNSALYKSLQNMMKSEHTWIISYDDTRNKFRYTDCVESDYSSISSFYSGQALNGAWDGGSTWNREHTWPNSKGDLAGSGENDIMMLRPASVSENSSRGNKAYGESDGYYDPNGEGQSVRGDCARIVLYQYVRWGCINTGSQYDPQDIFGTKGVIQSLDILLGWMQADPVDTWEMGRNDSVESITGTRNVFVDYPEYAWLLFGRDVPENMTTPSGMAKNMPDNDDNTSSDSSSSDNSSDSSSDSSSNNSSDTSGDSSSDSSNDTEKEYTYQSFNKDQRALLNNKFGFTVPFLSNNFYRLKEYSTPREDLNKTEIGVRFYTYNNTQDEFNKYKSLFTTANGYTSAGESTGDNQVTVYHFAKDDCYIDLSYYVNEGNYIANMYIYKLSDSDTVASDTDSGNHSSDDSSCASSLSVSTMGSLLLAGVALCLCKKKKS